MTEFTIQKSLNLLVKSSILVFLGIVLSKILTYVHRIIIARYFGVDAYGIYSLALVCVGWFVAFASLGLSEGCLRYFAVFKEKKDIQSGRLVMKYALTLLAISGFILGLLIFLFAEYIGLKIFNSPELVLFLKWFSLSIPITTLTLPFINLIRAYERIGTYTLIYSVLQNLIKVILLFFFALIGLGYASAIISSYLIAIGAVLVIAYIYVRDKLSSILIAPLLAKEKKKKIQKELFRYSIPLLFYSIFSSILYWVDSMSLGYYKTTFEVGLYNAAVPLALLIAIVPELFNQLFFPMITRLQTSGKIIMAQQLTKQVTKWIFAINLPIFIILFFYPGAVINILFGEEFLPATSALRLLSLNVLISSVGIVMTTIVSASGKSKLVFINIFVAALLNIILNSLLVPINSIFGFDNSNGLIGAAIATLISISVLNILFVVQAKQILKVFPFRWKMVLVAASAIIPSIILSLLSSKATSSLLGIIFAGLIFLITYSLNLLLFKALDRYDLKTLKEIKEKLYILGRKR